MSSSTANDPRQVLPTLLHSPVRLAMLAALRSVQHAEYAALQEGIGITSPELSRQLALLENEGLVEIAKFRKGRQSVTQVRISAAGRQRFEQYLDGLRRIAFDGAFLPDAGR